jgi:outer membrane receptor for Fe3+-dicitrate
MGSKKKNGKEIRIIIDRPTNIDYTFIDDGSIKLDVYFNNNSLPRESRRKEENDISYAVRRQSDKLKNTTNSLRFKTSKRTKAQSNQTHSPVYE